MPPYNQSFQATENCVFWFLLHCHCFSSSWKNADVENKKSTVLTDAPAEVQPCEGWCFPVGERDWQPWQPWPQVVYIFIHEPTWTKALRANCPLLSQNRLRAVMMRAHCRQNGSMNLCKPVLLVKAIRSRNFSFSKRRQSQFSSFLDLNSSTCQSYQQQNQILKTNCKIMFSLLIRNRFDTHCLNYYVLQKLSLSQDFFMFGFHKQLFVGLA